MNLQSGPESASKNKALLPALERLGLPLFLFGAVFLVLTIGMIKLLSPDRFPVHIGGKVLRLTDLAAEQVRLKDEFNALTQTRQELIASQDLAPVLKQVHDRKAEMLPIGSVLLQVETLRSSFATSSIDPIALPGIQYDGAGKTLTLTGFVTDPAGGSNHILASFVDGLRSLPRISSVTEPEYVQVTSEAGLRTPFTLTLRFSDAS